MSVFRPNLDKFASTFFVAPIGRYELQLLKTTFAKRKAKDVEKATVRFSFVIKGSDEHGNEFNDKPVSYDQWIEKEEDFNTILRIAMCALGIMPGTEQADAEFKTRFGDLDLSIDPDSGILGSGYEKLLNGRVSCQLSARADKNDPTKMYQQFGGWKAI